VTRTDRLYAIVAELRASPRSARELAERFEVGVRGIERDIVALRRAGVPIDAVEGGGYALDGSRMLPPVSLTAPEAVALAIGGAPHARSGLLKIVAAMAAADGAETRSLAEEMRLLIPDDERTGVPELVEQAVAARQVLRLAYVDRGGAETRRDVEPVAFVAGAADRYLIGWCRLREGPRLFRLDRIRQAGLLDEIAPPRDFEKATPSVQDLLAHALSLG
jgi:predicted DNA-binding transcriptional regulator YafY